MSEEEQRERIRRNQEWLSNQKKEALTTGINHVQYQRSSPPREEVTVFKQTKILS